MNNSPYLQRGRSEIKNQKQKSRGKLVYSSFASTDRSSKASAGTCNSFNSLGKDSSQTLAVANEEYQRTGLYIPPGFSKKEHQLRKITQGANIATTESPSQANITQKVRQSVVIFDNDTSETPYIEEEEEGSDSVSLTHEPQKLASPSDLTTPRPVLQMFDKTIFSEDIAFSNSPVISPRSTLSRRSRQASRIENRIALMEIALDHHRERGLGGMGLCCNGNPNSCAIF